MHDRRATRSDAPGPVPPLTEGTTVASPRVAVVGFQGFGNVGDEAILAGIERLLGGDVRVATVFAGGQRPVVAFRHAPQRSTFHFLPTLPAVRALARADVLLFAGGGLMNDYWPSVIPRYLAWVLAGRIAGCRIVWIGAGVGPIRRRTHRRLAGLAFRASRSVIVRDESSRGWVRRCAPTVAVQVIPDPAFFAPSPPALPAAATASLGTTGIVVRAPAPGSRGASETLLDALAALVADLGSQGQDVRLLTMHDPVDAPFVARLQERCLNRGAQRPTVTALPLAPDEAIAGLAGFGAIVTVRLHGLILAALAGVPAVSLRYDDKVAAAAAELGLADLCLPLEGLTPVALAGALAAAAEPGRRDALAIRVAEIRSRADAVRGLLVRALG